MPGMRNVYSSHVQSIGHDPEMNELHVTWRNGRTSIYSDVDAEKAKAIMNSPSIGSALGDQVKGQHDHRYA